MHVSDICVRYTCQCLYVVMHALYLVGVIVVASYMVTGIMIEMILIHCYGYDYTCIVLIWLILQTRYPPMNYTEVC